MTWFITTSWFLFTLSDWSRYNPTKPSDDIYCSLLPVSINVFKWHNSRKLWDTSSSKLLFSKSSLVSVVKFWNALGWMDLQQNIWRQYHEPINIIDFDTFDNIIHCHPSLSMLAVIIVKIWNRYVFEPCKIAHAFFHCQVAHFNCGLNHIHI